ncbi:hypothetical protein BsWGS_14646 [Bradybaena similaris]
MYYFRQYSDNHNVERRDYEHSIRERANESLDELRNSLEAVSHRPDYVGSGDGKSQLTRTVHPRILTWEDGRMQPPEDSKAAMQLRNMLSTHTKTSNVQTGQPVQQEALPSPEEAATLLKNQAVYTSHLEAESRYVKEEMAVLRMKLAEVIEENRMLHRELKTAVVHEILKDGGDLVQFLGTFDDPSLESYSNIMGRHDLKRWQVELERLSKLHTAKANRLETQLQHSKMEVERLEQTVEDLKAQLRMQESIPTHENGLIGGFFASETEKHITHNTIEKLTKERDELMDHVTSLKSQLKDMVQREEDAYQQMKKGIQLVEQAQLEQTEAFVQKEQVCDELARLRERFEHHIIESQNLIKTERESTRRENQLLVDDLNRKLTELGEHYSLIQARYEKEVRDKATLSAEISELKSQLRTCDREVTVTAESFRTETTNASLQRNSALYESNRLRSELEKLKHEHDQEMIRTKIELDDLRQRLTKAERELINSKEECIHMASNTQALERELHLAKMARDAIERTRSEDLLIIRKKAQDREDEIKMKMEDAEDKHNQYVHEMDSMLLKQNKLISKLREECKRQAQNLEKTVKKYRVGNNKLNQTNAEMTGRMERMAHRVLELEDQADQHSRVHDKMKERLKSLDEQGQNQAVQIVEVLTKYSQVCRERHLLAREVEFLRTQLHRANQISPETLRLNSSSKPLVDDILNSLTKDERDGTMPLIPQLRLHAGDLPDKPDAEDLQPKQQP